MYEVIYHTVNGLFSLPSFTLAEAKQDVDRLRLLNQQPGHAAWGIKIAKVK